MAETASTGALRDALNTALPASPTLASPYELAQREGWIEVTTSVQITGVGPYVDLFTVLGACEMVIDGSFYNISDAAMLMGCYLGFYDGTLVRDITSNVGTDCSGVLADSWFGKTAPNTLGLKLANTTTGTISEGTEQSKSVLYPFVLSAKNGVSSYIRLYYIGAAPTDLYAFITILYKPRTSGALVEAV